MNLVQPVILKKKKNLPYVIYSQRARKKKKRCCVVNTRALHEKKIDDGKEKLQIIKFYDFAKGGTDIVDQLKDY